MCWTGGDHSLTLVEVQLHTHSGNEVEWDRFLCELVDSGVSVRSPWERSKRLKFQMHTLLRVESLVSKVE